MGGPAGEETGAGDFAEGGARDEVGEDEDADGVDGEVEVLEVGHGAVYADEVGVVLGGIFGGGVSGLKWLVSGREGR